MTKRLLVLIVLLLTVSATTFADGGRLRFSQTSGPFLVTLFTAPEPLTRGPADFSIMVQDAKTGDILPDAKVTLLLTSVQGNILRAVASHGIATNRLLQAAQFDLPTSGNWSVHVDVQQGSQSSSVDANVSVQPGSRKAVLVWIFAVLPLVALLLFTLHQRQKAFLARRSLPTAR